MVRVSENARSTMWNDVDRAEWLAKRKDAALDGILAAPEDRKATVHRCTQCGKDMGNEWILGPVCGRCCRDNHRRVAGR